MITTLKRYKRYSKYIAYSLIEKCFLLATGNWKYFYGWYLDRQDHAKNALALKELGKTKRKKGYDKGLYDTSMGDYHLKFLVSCGLNPQSKVLDLGFGFGRTTVPLVKYLKPNNYIGSEISKERLRIASEWLCLEGLESRNARLVLALDNRFDFISTGLLDFVWAQSVFTHLPEKELIDILRSLKSKLSHDGAIIFDFTVADKSQNGRLSIKDFCYTPEKIDEIVHNIGYSIEYLNDWKAELNKASQAIHNKMVKLTIKWR